MNIIERKRPLSSIRFADLPSWRVFTHSRDTYNSGFQPAGPFGSSSSHHRPTLKLVLQNGPASPLTPECGILTQVIIFVSPPGGAWPVGTIELAVYPAVRLSLNCAITWNLYQVSHKLARVARLCAILFLQRLRNGCPSKWYVDAKEEKKSFVREKNGGS